MSAEKPWSTATPIPNTPPDSYEPALAPVGDVLHAVWVSNKALYHARYAEGRWTEPLRFANGEQPALAAGPGGALHCVFSHQFLGNSEIYYTRWDGVKWSLPQRVSRTSGASSNPALAVAPDGSTHIAWADTTPGESVIYYARPQGVAWAQAPIPNATGSRPAIALTPAGEIIVAWQSRLAETGIFEVVAAVRREEAWSLPEIVSDEPNRHSISPALAVNPQGSAHLIWQEEARNGIYVIRHAERLPGGWSAPANISASDQDARLPRLAAAPKGFLQAVWAEDASLKHRGRPAEPRALWWGEEVACPDCPGVSSLATAISPATGELHAVWSAYQNLDQRRLYHAFRKALIRHTVFIPIVSRSEG
ncbi:MAG: hypothetical protein N2204_04460 [Anaerolineae bacterium]|nr:hypothetical protein [Anaerolineae bacterium]